MFCKTFHGWVSFFFAYLTPSLRVLHCDVLCHLCVVVFEPIELESLCGEESARTLRVCAGCRRVEKWFNVKNTHMIQCVILCLRTYQVRRYQAQLVRTWLTQRAHEENRENGATLATRHYVGIENKPAGWKFRKN